MQASVEEDLPQATMSVFKDRPFFFFFFKSIPLPVTFILQKQSNAQVAYNS